MVVAMFPQILRKLQLQIEEQGQYLQKMFEKQREMEDDSIKAFASNRMILLFHHQMWCFHPLLMTNR
jgi:hypothetical protein